MYAIIKIGGNDKKTGEIHKGGRQLKVEVNEQLYIDYLGEKETGSVIEFSEVLAISKDGSEGKSGNVIFGQPTIPNAKVIAEVISDVKGPKLIIAKFRRRKNSRRKTGHRQIYTLVKIKEIVG
ncbi:50S ribosomal protein L21 [Planctomycetales bacterium]|nr:50S ribosomal protein L21 [Planctomycetales bacterium]